MGYKGISLKKLTLENFENTAFGEIDFSEKITGIHGQSCTGKSTVIRALSILKTRVSGGAIISPEQYIRDDEADAKLTYQFDLSSDLEEGTTTLIYIVRIHKAELAVRNAKVLPIFDENGNISFENTDEDIKEIREEITIFDSVKIKYPNKSLKTIIDTDSGTKLFEPKEKCKMFVNVGDDMLSGINISTLEGAKEHCEREENTSFVFLWAVEYILSLINGEDVEVINKLIDFAKKDLFILDETFEYNQLPLYTDGFVLSDMGNKDFKEWNIVFELFNYIVPELTLNGNTLMRGDKELTIVPINVKKTLTKLVLYASALVNSDVFVAIDDFDANLREDVFGNLLSFMEENGKGNLLFTANVLRSLESIKKDSNFFTTLDPNNRYMIFMGIRGNSNPRDTYLKNSKNRDKNETALYTEFSEDRLKALL